MNCDDAFEQLTDPQQSPSAELEWHLTLCPRCRQMRDVIEPALQLFAGNDPPREPACGTMTAVCAASVPLLSPEAVRLAEQTARELGLETRPLPTIRRRWLTAAMCASGVAVGLLLSFGAMALVEQEKTSAESPVPAVAGTICPWKSSAPAIDQSARTVVLSCVACHLK